MIEPAEIEKKIRASLGEVDEIEIEDLTGTRDHYAIVVVSEAFEGVSRVSRQRMIYDALAEEMKGPIHALSMKTWTPEEWSEQ
jgi:stress-induced morphogen